MVCAPVRRDNFRALARGLSTVGAQTMPYLTCTTITSVDLAHYGVSRAKDWVSVDCGTKAMKGQTYSYSEQFVDNRGTSYAVFINKAQ